MKSRTDAPPRLTIGAAMALVAMIAGSLASLAMVAWAAARIGS